MSLHGDPLAHGPKQQAFGHRGLGKALQDPRATHGGGPVLQAEARGAHEQFQKTPWALCGPCGLENAFSDHSSMTHPQPPPLPGPATPQAALASHWWAGIVSHLIPMAQDGCRDWTGLAGRGGCRGGQHPHSVPLCFPSPDSSSPGSPIASCVTEAHCQLRPVLQPA